ncbi:MAG TPA: hypothetical protein VMU00_03710 [Steroidobacteraceae bacterium]|nr:hypothetical protein [Steroidobacteraceae bacterium]
MQTGTDGLMALIVALAIMVMVVSCATLLIKNCAPWISASAPRAYAGAVGLTVFAMALMPFGLWLVGGLIVLLALRGGPVSDGRMAGLLGLILALWLHSAAGVGPGPALLIAAAATVPALLLGRLLLRSGSLNLVFQLATLGALGFVLVVHVVLADPPGVWRPLVERVAGELDRMGAVMSTTGLARVQEENFIQASAERMWGVVSWLLLLTAMISVFLGIYWQGRVEHVTRLAARFRELSAGRTLAAFAVLALAGTVMFRSGLAADAALVLLGAFVLQGLALLHAAHYAFGLGTAWLVAPYALLFGGFTTAIMLIALAVSGFVDNWYPLRRWLPVPPAERG